MLRRRLTSSEIEEIEHLIKISKDNPINPDTFIPWEIPPKDTFDFMPKTLFSLYGDKLFDTLTSSQKTELAKSEVGQAMYSYGWSEGLACLFFYRYLVTLRDNVSAEYRYLLVEIFEETCHQQMFSRAIETLNIQTVSARPLHRFVSWFATRYLPADVVFMSVLAIELVTEMYGSEIIKQHNMYPVLAKISELHKIEEDRHMFFADLLLKRYTENASFFRRSLYSIVVCLNIYFMRTLYVRKEILQRIGLDPKIYYKPAYRGLKQKFSENCLQKAKDFVSGWNGFNWFTKIFWRKLLGAKI